MASWSHWDTQHSVWLLCSSDQPDAETRQQNHSQQTDIHPPGGIRTRNPRKRAAAHIRLRQRGHWDRLFSVTNTHTHTHTHTRIYIYICLIKSWQAITDTCANPGKLGRRRYSIILKINRIIPFIPRFTKWLRSVVVPHPTIVWISYLFQECNMTRPSFLPLFCAL